MITPADWARIHLDTERAIEHMKRVIEWAEKGKKHERAQSGENAPLDIKAEK